MALPADFSKIYGSTATGGLTPISDVNYAKGWEFVGSNPPTKNDFSYLQNLSDLKSQWLYSNKLQRANPFGDIKSDGAAAVAAALSNLGIKSAAQYEMGNLAGQIPSMSSFVSTFLGAGASIGGEGEKTLPDYNSPSGMLILKWGAIPAPTTGGGDVTKNFPTPFPNKCLRVFATADYEPGTGNVMYIAVNNSTLQRDRFVARFAGSANYTSGVYFGLGY